jgi:hypothetical protein
MEGAGAHLIVVRLKDQAALLRPELLESEDQVLKGLGLWILHRRAPETRRKL